MPVLSNSSLSPKTRKTVQFTRSVRSVDLMLLAGWKLITRKTDSHRLTMLAFTGYKTYIHHGGKLQHYTMCLL